MRNLRMVRRGDDMALYGLVTRVGMGKYEVVIKFVTSKRMLHKEQLSLPNREAVQRFYEREFPTLTWGEPKFAKPRVKVARQPKKAKPHVKPKRKRAKNTARQLARKSDQHGGGSGAALKAPRRRHVARRPAARKGAGDQAVE